MQLFNDVSQKVGRFVSENATTLLTAGGVVGTVATAVLAGRGGIKAGRLLEQEETKIVHDASDPRVLDDLTKLERVKLVGIHFAPPVLSGSVTIAAIIMANRMSAQKAAALAAAYGLAERNLSEYKEKVSEKLTGPKRQQIDDELAQEAVNKTPGHNTIVIGDGEVLCLDKPTGRYFRSTMQTIQQAVNTTNAEILHHDHASASFFYEELGMPATTWTDEVGWNHDRLLELTYSTVLTDDNKPCIAIDFKSLPKVDYIPKHY